ncbi:zinc ribbon domain-containing protein [Clostridium saccharobutylicum]|uniref:Zinc-ribbon domain protein n=1 Tax=Clostridium saccharobutylicum DSM 13864 TaxID=1345695 RepID=U5MZJ6_CLOSA|nr:zinc ribbon domain-containing protein [Clostridium saccharobutylicum]AGX45096.1 zinc-ribbon domain protein [Clostridium saccharobutylicum DSM 13864]AQR92378.1 hypothetical protein CLOSC_41080 [Clostridium saccharobutylicum]AQS02281.1 hypothetical protein CSACC_41140 [Clostridium saccharobutylicum]AQS11885.1 hypothetical protein CLOBY_40430 [Clostridium saccharobutylicum]AQS16264.1 hypothetical protein CLOSACC_41140 [Clostridium saccharobutylicum]
MFCKNCGNEILNGDRFCGNCGQPVEGAKPEKVIISSKLNDSVLMKLLKIYFVKPVSFFTELQGEDLVKTSVALFFGLSIINGLFNIIYSSALINSLFGMIRKVPDMLADVGILSKQEAAQATKEMLMSNQMADVKSKINAMIDNKEIFLTGFGHLIIMMIATAIILAILNATILKNKIQLTDVFFISTSSYIPLVISIALGSLATLISIVFGAFVITSGYILSFITLYSGIRQISDEKNDKVFTLMAILFLVISAVLSILVVQEIQSSIMTIVNNVNSIKQFL